MKIVLCSSESLPFKKTGGLADVVDGLSKQLAKKNEVYVFMPQYKNINFESYDLVHVDSYMMNIGNQDVYVGINRCKHYGVNYVFIDNLTLFGYRDNPYGYEDDCYRFGFFSKACLDAILLLKIDPDVIHLNDWHTGIMMNYLTNEYFDSFKGCRKVLTIHNLAFQGICSSEIIRDLNLVDDASLYMDENVNFLKIGIILADKINTVSKSYRDDTLTKRYGNGLSSVLNLKKDVYTGILNGIDTDVFSSRKNENIYINYNETNYNQGKYFNRETFKRQYCVFTKERAFFSLVSRLTSQKGIDLLLEIIKPLSKENLDLYILGDGEKYYVDELIKACNKYDNIFIHVGYNEKLAHRLYAASDFFLMPSKFEPCGLSQLIALSFATIPIVSNIHGLKDSIIDYRYDQINGTGIKLAEISSQELLDKIRYCLNLYNCESRIIKLRENAINSNFSWELREKEYLDLYK